MCGVCAAGLRRRFSSRIFSFHPPRAIASHGELNADVLAHVLGFIAHEQWEYHMKDTPLSCVQRLNQVFSSLAIMLTAELRRCTPRGCSRRETQ